MRAASAVFTYSLSLIMSRLSPVRDRNLKKVYQTLHARGRVAAAMLIHSAGNIMHSTPSELSHGHAAMSGTS
jgi:hypothetical protein